MDGWESAWISIRCSPADGGEVTFLHWYAPFDGHLAMVVAGDDPLINRVGSGDRIAVAPVRHRRGPTTSRHLSYEPANIELLDESMADEVNGALNRKYGWRRRLFRAASLLVRRLGGPSHGRVDVPVRIAIDRPS